MKLGGTTSVTAIADLRASDVASAYGPKRTVTEPRRRSHNNVPLFLSLSLSLLLPLSILHARDPRSGKIRAIAADRCHKPSEKKVTSRGEASGKSKRSVLRTG